MAYPFAEAPTFEGFVKQLADNFGCVLKMSKRKLARTNSDPPEAVQYLERVVNGKALQCVVVFDEGPEARVAPSVIRSICARLGIDPAFFGLTLG